MPRPDKKRDTGCPVAFALDTFGDRWSLLVIRDLLLKGRETYGDFLAGGEGIATNVLADRLKELEAAEIIKKMRDPENRKRFLYSLTDKGFDLAPVVLEMMRWSGKYDPGSILRDHVLERIEQDRETYLAELDARRRLKLDRFSGAGAEGIGGNGSRSSLAVSGGDSGGGPRNQEIQNMDLPQVPLPKEGLFITHFLTVADQTASRAFYEGILGGVVVASDDPTFVKLANSWIILNRGGGPTPDKPDVILEPPQDPTRVNSFLNLRVADIWACYDEWKAKGAKFLTEPLDNHGWETRCYMQDPDGYIIEVGEAHQKMVDFLTGAKG